MPHRLRTLQYGPELCTMSIGGHKCIRRVPSRLLPNNFGVFSDTVALCTYPKARKGERFQMNTSSINTWRSQVMGFETYMKKWHVIDREGAGRLY